MKLQQGIATALIAAALSMPVSASAAPTSGAEKLRRLDVMLLVTSLRCRASADDFQQDYGDFVTAHSAEMAAANKALRLELVASAGKAGADAALDRLGVTMANTYGQGHPWLDCHELKSVTRNLAAAKGVAPLQEAAAQLLSGDSSRMALSGE